MLSRSGVNGILISWFAALDTSTACQVKIAELLQVTGAYSISGEPGSLLPASISKLALCTN